MLRKEVANGVLTGSEDEAWSSSNFDAINRYRTLVLANDGGGDRGTTDIMSTHNVGISNTTSDASALGIALRFAGSGATVSSGLFFSFPLGMCDTLAEARVWFAENQPEYYYALAVPVITQITDETLVKQLEALWSAELYDDITMLTVSSVTDAPAKLLVEARTAKTEEE